ncbi:MAG: response regulator [Anaerolineae bacterium]|jgi:DNA-binding response OmpR family regulator|nr:response regulator [Anaerolineae bacterium]
MTTGQRILIVDDEAFIRVLLKQTLEDLEDRGVELLTAADGQEALAVALREHPDLILLDVMMPRLNGYEVCRQVKATDQAIYVVLLTAKGQAVDKQEGALAGADEYVTKPFDPDYILTRAADILGITL